MYCLYLLTKKRIKEKKKPKIVKVRNIYFSFEGLNSNDRDIELIKQTNTLSNVNQTTKNLIEKPHSLKESVRKNEDLSNEEHDALNLIIENTSQMEKSNQQNSTGHVDTTRSSETSDVIILTTAISLKV